MFRRQPEPLSPETRALLAEERELDAAPDALRRRALGRARRAAALSPLSGPPSASNELLRRSRPFLARAAAAVAVGGLAAATWLNQRGSPPTRVQTPTETRANATPTTSLDTTLPATAPPNPTKVNAGNPTSASSASELPRASEAGEGRRAELTLVEATRRSVAARNYADALALVAEHERRFPRGVFVEEREAMRIKVLWGLGRQAQARAVVSTFRARFPRSILLPSLERLVRAVP